jgi:hypothetical protein
LKHIAIELIITLISIVGLIRFLIIDQDPVLHYLVIAGIGLSIIYLIVRIVVKIQNHQRTRAVKQILLSKLKETGSGIKYYINLILFNHPECINLMTKGPEEFKLEENAKKFFEVDLRHPDPRNGTSMGNMAEQIGNGLPGIIEEVDMAISKYASVTGHFKELDKYEKLRRNEVFRILLNVKAWFEQNTHFQEIAKRTNITFPEEGLPITVGVLYEDQIIQDYNEFIDIVFELENCA